MSTPGSSERLRSWGLAAALGTLWILVGAFWLALFIGSRLAGTVLPPNPVAAVLGVLAGTTAWPGGGTTLALSCELLIAISVIGATLGRRRRRRGSRTRVDGPARHLGRGRDLDPYSPAQIAATARRLRPGGVGRNPAEHGVFLGPTVAPPRRVLRASWEDTMLLFAGPRRLKTSCFVIPQLIEAPGPALVTSLRRDVFDATVDLRAQRGTVWCFDPQQLINTTSPGWWFNPLAGVHDIDDARKLKDHFVAGTRSADARTDSYFDVEGERLLAGYILAAACKRDTLLDVYAWLTDPSAIEPVNELTKAGQDQVAAGINAIRRIPAEKQKAGIYGSATSLVSCLENPRVTRWVAPKYSGLPQFDPDEFVTTSDTLYLHSKNGEGNVSPLVAALTQAVLDAGQRRAAACAGSRLDPPLLATLDEAANVCRIRNLPDQYSYLGGFGLVVITVLQSFEQGVEVWGRTGMRKLLDTANVRIYGGGLVDGEFLRHFSELLGDYDAPVASTSYDDHNRASHSHQTRRQRILDPADLAALPRGRAIVLAAGVRPTVIAPQSWIDGPYAAQIRASIAAHDPGVRALDVPR